MGPLSASTNWDRLVQLPVMAKIALHGAGRTLSKLKEDATTHKLKNLASVEKKLNLDEWQLWQFALTKAEQKADSRDRNNDLLGTGSTKQSSS